MKQTIKLRAMSERPKNHTEIFLVFKTGGVSRCIIKSKKEWLYTLEMHAVIGWLYADELQFEVESK